MLLSYIGIALSLTAVALVSAMMGIGGGSLLTSLQVIFGIEIHTAVATSLFLIIILSLSATRIYKQAGKIDWKMALTLEIFTFSGGFLGGYFSKNIPGDILAYTLVFVIIFSGVMILRNKNSAHPHITKSKSWYHWDRSYDANKYTINCLIVFPISFIAGILSGTFGIGGGVLKVPLMILIIGMPADIAIATSVLMVGLTACGGLAGHLIVGHFNWKLALMLSPSVFIGAWIGAHTMLKINKDKLKKIFAVFMFIIASILVFKLSGC